MLKFLLEYFVIKKSGLFNPVYYLLSYPDVREGDIDPLVHFIRYGWREGRNPSEEFNTTQYLEVNPDVRFSRINPLLHYIKFGRNEGRKSIDAKIVVSQENLPDKNFLPKVSIIVPNYNHEKYLQQRLESIYKQTYSNIEVILLDDNSSDNSISILKQFQNDYPSITQIYVNEKNSGSPFAQWQKGMGIAAGDLIWIAESDDYCDLDFLEKLVPLFQDTSVLLAYAHTVFVDNYGKQHPFAFEGYVGQLDKSKWKNSYIETAHNEVNHNLGLLNTIPNVSSVVFRKVHPEFPLFSNSTWMSMKVCGDWLFYLHLIRGGRIAYSVETNDYYRIHNESSSKKTHNSNVYYKEHEIIACAIARLYKIPETLLDKFYLLKKDFYEKNVGGVETDLQLLLNIDKAKQEMQKRLPNLLMGVNAFSYGGGEVFPIKLGNALYDLGLGITFFDGGYDVYQENVRKMLYPSIGIIKRSDPEHTKKSIKDFGIEIIHSHHVSLDNYFSSINRNNDLNSKFIVSMHGMYEIMTNFEDIIRNIYPNIDNWVYAADKNIQPFKKSGLYSPERFTKIQNGMDFSSCSGIDLADLGIDKSSFVICLASRALPSKGWHEAVDAVIQVRNDTQRDVHILLIGEGPVYDELLSKGLPSFIHLLGYKPNLNEYLASSHLGLLPTYFPGESYPLVLIQYIFAGIPVVVSNIGEIENMISSPTGELGGGLIELHNGMINTNDLRDEIIKMVIDSEHYRKHADVIKELAGKYKIEKTAQQYCDVYTTVLQSPRRTSRTYLMKKKDTLFKNKGGLL